MSDQELEVTLEQAVFGAMLVGVAATAFQVAFQGGGYATPTETQHELMVKSIAERAKQLALGDASPVAAEVAIKEHVQQVVRIVLGPAPIASSLN